MKSVAIVLFSLFFVSCSSVKQMEVYVTKPTLVPLPSDVKRIVFVDKTQGNFLTAIEGVLTGEMIGIDKVLSQECMTGLKNPFLNHSQIQVTQHPERLKSENMTSTGFGTVMNPTLIDQIAKQHNADALLVIEYFDSDFTVREVSSPNNLGSVLFQGHAKAKVGIRIYLPKTQNIFFENSFSYAKNYGETAASKAQLLGKLAVGTDAMKFVSRELGKIVARRFVSYKTWEDRIIIKGKTDITKRAERQIIAQDYDNAIITLEKAFKTEQNNETKSGIAHNLGYCYEVKGDLQLAKKWLTEAFTISGSGKSRRYLDIINQRIKAEYLLDVEEED